MNQNLKITISVIIPQKDFSYESQEAFTRATIALFRGMFPSVISIPHREEYLSPITVEFNETVEEE